MKRLLTVLIAAAVTLTAYPAFAMILGSPHDFTGQAGAGGYVYGTCDMCHVPHAAKERKRLWNNTTITSIGGVNNWSRPTHGVELLCASCHVNTNFTVQNKGGMSAHQVGTTAYADTSHSNDLSVLRGTLDTTAPTPIGTTNVLPYTETGVQYMECTSCHNPHQDGGPSGDPLGGSGIRPFLRADSGDNYMSDFCAKCHTTRESSGTAALSATDYLNGDPKNVAPAVYSDFVNNHPVNVTYGDNATNGVGWFKDLAAGSPVLTAVYGVGANNALKGWSLGGKMQNSAGDIPQLAYSETVSGTGQGGQQIGCMTCHAVHNPAVDAGGAYQGLWLLAVANSGQAGDGKADLCETCHGQALTGGRWETRAGGVATTSTFGMDHPIDGTISAQAISTFITSWSAGTTPFASTSRLRSERVPSGVSQVWPTGNFGGSPAIICTSCHSAHHAGTRLRRVNGDTTDWCKSCHPSVSPLGHHSHMDNDNNSVLKCGDCHADAATYTGLNPSITGNGLAHNGFVFYNLGGDNTGASFITPGEPLTNLATTNPVSNPGGCSECHVDAQSLITYPSGIKPGVLAPPVNRLGDVKDDPYVVSHFMGTFDTNAKGVGINVKTGYWNNNTMLPAHNGKRRDFSKFGNPTGVGPNGTSYQIGCESCHSILGNIGRATSGPILAGISSGWENNLLLQNYQDDSYYGEGQASNPATGVNSGNTIPWATQANAQTVGSGLCVGCHNQSDTDPADATPYNVGATGNGAVPDNVVQNPKVTPPNMHPMTGWSISKAQDAGRTPYTLVTQDSEGTYANGAGRPPQTGGSTGGGVGEGAVSYPAADQMDCDSCHRPHNAPDNGFLPSTHIKVRTLSNSAIGDVRVTTSSNTGLVGVPVILEYADTSNPNDDNTGALCMQCHNY